MFVELIGKWLANMPEAKAVKLCEAVARLMERTHKGEITRRNLKKCFPELSEEELRRLTHEACARTIELGMMGLAGKYFDAKRRKETIKIDEKTLEFMQSTQESSRGVLFLIPHTTLMEACTALPLFFNAHKPTSVLYRAFKSKALEREVLQGRQTMGIRLLNRKTGKLELARALKRGENGGMLFDQNSGRLGALISFMGRLTAVTDLQDILYHQAGRPLPVFLMIRRTAFWRGEIVAVALPEPKDETESLSIAVHRELEKHLRNPATRTDWLWAHNRWKALASRQRRLGLNHKEVKEVPTEKKFSVVARLPKNLREALSLLALLRAMRRSRPDMQLTLLTRSRLIETFLANHAADRCLGLPKSFFSRVKFCGSLKKEYFDMALDFEGSLSSRIELSATQIKERYTLNPTSDLAASAETFARSLGLTGDVEKLSAPLPTESELKKIPAETFATAAKNWLSY